MRPRSVIRPRVSRASVNVVAIRPRAHVAARVPGPAAERADRPTRLHERPRALDERRRLDTADLEARRRRRLGRLEERGLGQRLRAGAAELGEEAREVVGEGADVLLLALEGDDLTSLAGLQIEDALARRAEGARGEVVGSLQVE